MSTILNALRKSERERTLVRGVGFGDAGRRWAPEPSYTWWRWVALALALVALAVLALLWRSRSAGVIPPSAPMSQPVSVSMPAATTATAPLEMFMDAALDTAATPAPREAKFLTTLPQDFQRSVPPMAVTIHVYTPNESERILYINNRQYRPGEQIGSGVMVEDIIPEGALLQLRGRRFKLPRPS
jgi:hypothetical protein